MTMNFRTTFKLLSLVAASLPLNAAAGVTLPSFFSDGMVLRHDSQVKIWGWAKPHEPVKLSASWTGDVYTTEGDADATWSVVIPTPSPSSQPYTITIEGYNRLQINNVAIGEVILCAGQSNMEWSVGAGIEGKDALVAQSANDDVRMFNVDYRSADRELIDLSGRWQVASPSSVPSFSAIGYVIARRLNAALGIPVGVINSSWGGTPIEAWTPSEAYEMCDYLNSQNKLLGPNEWGPTRPGAIYNAMIAPLSGYKISAIAWYQGEENTKNPQAYTDMMYALVNGFRQIFDAHQHVVYAQIAPYNYGSGNGAAIRERQRRAMDIPNSSMVVIGQYGNPDDIHPRKKIEAGELFASALLHDVFGRTEYAYASPVLKDVQYSKGKAYVSFANADGLHVQGAKSPNLFEVAGVDGVFHQAKARLLKDGRVEVTAKEVKTPVAVRYAWADAAMPNLFNASGRDASIFTTQEVF